MTTSTTSLPSVTGMRMAHRMMTSDLVRLTATASRIADGTTRCPDARAAALARWLDELAVEIHHHHQVEDDTAWPVIEAAAGAHVDLAVLTDDHDALDPMLDRMQAAAAALVATPEARRAEAARPLAAALTELRDHLTEHIEAEEQTLFPVIRQYVPVAEWEKVEAVASSGGGRAAFRLPRILDALTPEERDELFGKSGAVARLMTGVVAALLRPGHRRRERLVFG